MHYLQRYVKKRIFRPIDLLELVKLSLLLLVPSDHGATSLILRFDFRLILFVMGMNADSCSSGFEF